jgi:hypothetical protein
MSRSIKTMFEKYMVVKCLPRSGGRFRKPINEQMSVVAAAAAVVLVLSLHGFLE